jgi:hypothetical protein
VKDRENIPAGKPTTMNKKTKIPTAERCKVIACATVLEEMLPLMPPGMKYQRLEFGLHNEPDKLKKSLQEAIDAVEPDIDTVLLGYGLCSRSVTGLKSEKCTLVIPKIDDCIGIFLGSLDEYNRQHRSQPGTLYYTKGWIEAHENPHDQMPDLVKKYGEAKAQSYFKILIKNYTRMVFINTGNYKIESYRERIQTSAKELNLRYEEIKGSNALIKKMLLGQWDGDFVIAPPGKVISFLDFKGG